MDYLNKKTESLKKKKHTKAPQAAVCTNRSHACESC